MGVCHYEALGNTHDTNLNRELVHRRQSPKLVVKYDMERNKSWGLVLANSVTRQQHPDLLIPRLCSLYEKAKHIRHCGLVLGEC